MRFPLTTVSMAGLIVFAMLYVSDYAAAVRNQELAYEIATRDYRITLADCADDLVCSANVPDTTCRHPNDVLEVTADLGHRRRFPFGATHIKASRWFDAAGQSVNVAAVRSCGP
ncbi:MAG: hypothetical protein F4X74_10600 [Acidimicrobiia bacterium]|nr:hypothetical protein [Acidimicrobiia bacterium]